MAVQFIVGRAGAGKSHYLYEKLIEKSLKYRNKNFISIVPEQFSMETQKQILTMHPNRGSFNIEVTSLPIRFLRSRGLMNTKLWMT